jgi:glycosyltransferase involved in cell wall biosynthesis
VADRTIWAGWSDDVRSHVRSFDIFVLPSRFEGFPLAVLEALLAEKPVVAADVGSVSEAVIPGETGFLVPPDDAGALIKAGTVLSRDGSAAPPPKQGLTRRRDRDQGVALAICEFAGRSRSLTADADCGGLKMESDK